MKASLPLFAALVLASACGESEPEPLDPAEVAATARANLRRVAGELGDALSFLDETRVGGLLRGCAEEAGACEPWDAAGAVDELATLLAERVFTEDNVESRAGGTIVFRLRPETVCAGDEEGCATFLEQVPIRLRVTSEAAGDLEIALLVGKERHRPVEIGLRADALELQVDLADLRATLRLLGAEDADLPAVMMGRVSLAVSRHGPGDFTTSLSILEAIAVRSHGFGPWQLELGTALPAVAIGVHEGERKLTVRYGIGGLSLRGPIDAFFSAQEEGCTDCIEIEEELPVEGSAGLTLAGLSGEAALEVRGDGAEVLTVRNLGLGDDTAVLDVEGAPVTTVDLNPLTGRSLDLVATSTEAGTEIEVVPGLDLGIGLFLANVADRIEVPEWALEETLRIRLEGAAAPRIRLPAIDEALAEERVAVELLDGTLVLESDALGELRVEEGMCLWERPAAEGEHPFAGLAADTCGG